VRRKVFPSVGDQFLSWPPPLFADWPPDVSFPARESSEFGERELVDNEGMTLPPPSHEDYLPFSHLSIYREKFHSA